MLKLVLSPVIAPSLDDDVGGGALEGLGHVGDRTVLQHLRADGFHGTGRALAGGGTVTDDDHFVQQFAVLPHHDDAEVRRGRQFEILESHGGEDEDVRWPGIDGELTVVVGHDSVRGPFHEDYHTDQRQPVLVNDGPLDGSLVGLGCTGCGNLIREGLHGIGKEDGSRHQASQERHAPFGS